MFFGHPADEAFFLHRELAYQNENVTHIDFIHNFDYRCALGLSSMGVKYPSIFTFNPDTGKGVLLASNKTLIEPGLFKNVTAKTFLRSEEPLDEK